MTNNLPFTDFVMIAVIMISYRYKMNPDNLATPLAASIGDVVSISILSAIASQFFLRLDAEIWVLYVIFGVFLVLLPFWILIVLKNKYTKSVLKSGWVPILSALLISGLVKWHVIYTYTHIHNTHTQTEFYISNYIWLIINYVIWLLYSA